MSEKERLSMTHKFATTSDYYAAFSGETLKRLQALRMTVHELIPDAEERISYNMPAFFKDKKMVCYIAGYAQHVSMYPGRIPGPEYEKRFGEYMSGKSTLKFPHEKPLPLNLATEFVQLRLAEVAAENLK